MSLVFLILAILVFLVTAIISETLTEPNEALRYVAVGLALFAAAHITWPSNWGPGPR